MKKIFLILGMLMIGLLAACSNSDADLQKKVADKMRTEPLLNTVTVTAKDGNVTLGGEVDTQMQLKLAESMAREIVGVKKVDTKITIKPSGNSSVPNDNMNSVNSNMSNSNMRGK